MGKRGNPTGKGGFKDNPHNINKKGCPPKSEQMREVLSQHITGEQLSKILSEMAKTDKVVAMYLYDKIYGKTKESIEVDTPEGIEIIIKGDKKK